MFGINRYREAFLRPYRACRGGGNTQAEAHLRQHKVLVLEFEGLDWVLSTKDQSVFVFNKPLEILTLN